MINRGLLKYSVCTLLLFTVLVLSPSCSKTPEDILKGIAQEAQKDCPHIMDEFTTMISVEAAPNRILKYTYLAKQELSDEEKKMANAGMKKVLLDRLQSQPEFEFYKENDVSFVHTFSDKKGQTMVLVEISPMDYK